MNYFAHLFETPIGTLLSVVNIDNALALLSFCPNQEQAELLLSKEFGEACVVWDKGRSALVETQIGEYFRGERQTFTLPLHAKGTEFQHRVWDALVSLPYGETTTYGRLAALLGNSNASRAVGRANATNPIAIVVPCHRVIGAKGNLTGYAFGLSRKEQLLELERKHMS